MFHLQKSIEEQVYYTLIQLFRFVVYRLKFGFFKENAKFVSTRMLAIIFASSGALSWFFVLTVNFGFLFQNVTRDQFWVFIGAVLFFCFGAFSAILGGNISERVSRRKLLGLSVMLGVLSTGSLALLHGSSYSLLLGVLLGISFGLGFPTGAALFADRTKTEDRGRFAGILVLTTFILISVETAVAQAFNLGLIGVIVLAMLLRATGFLALIWDPCEEEKGSETTWRSIFARKNVALYLLPWVIFNLVSGLSNFIYPGLPHTSDYITAETTGTLLQFLAVAIVSLMSGFVSDRFGRKPPIIIGTVLFGASFALLGASPSPLSLIIQETTFGIAWGFCMVAYLAVPGDLASTYLKEKYYALYTVLPFVSFTGTMTMPLILSFSVPLNVLSPILSILLFFSVIPVLYASETLPESVLNERRLKEHVDKLGKIVAESKKT